MVSLAFKANCELLLNKLGHNRQITCIGTIGARPGLMESAIIVKMLKHLLLRPLLETTYCLIFLLK